MFDTNVLISAALFPSGKLSQAVFAIADRFDVVLSTRILDEFREVVARKFSAKKDISEQFLRHLRYEIAYTPKDILPDVFPHIRDPKDYPILASAILANVDAFISGDLDFRDIVTDYPEILSPPEFAEKYLH
jgi:putative PIN family toxin of toxin-antitoxin system